MDIWNVRAFIYQHFADTTRAPSMDETAQHFNISNEEAGEIYTELNNRHAFFLEPGTSTIRMANPFSNIPTDFKVHTNGKTYFANCAWDMLGIPAALGCDAVITAKFTESNEAVQLEVKDGQINMSSVTLSDSEGSLSQTNETLTRTASALRCKCRSRKPLPSHRPDVLRESDTLLVHFPLPFARWYDDLVFT